MWRDRVSFLTPCSSPSPRPLGEGRRGTRRGEGLLCVVAVVAIVIVRLMALTADPPAWLSWSTGIWTDEGFYTLDARHEALFGGWASGNFHDRLLSPLLSLLQQGAFGLFGPRLLVARLLSVAFGLLTLFVFWLGLRRLWSRQTADWGMLFLGLAPPVVFYNRLALQETPTVFWLVLSFTLWVYGRTEGNGHKRTLLLLLAGAALAVAITFKALALIALPGFAVGWWKDCPLLPNSGGRKKVSVALWPPNYWGRGGRSSFTPCSGTCRTTPNCRAWRRSTGCIRCSRTPGRALG